MALGGPDTTTRAQVVWQVKVDLGEGAPALPKANPTPTEWATWMETNWAAWRALWQPAARGRLKAKAMDVTDTDASNPCVVSPQSRYRGLENQLYRIEIHRGGVATDKLPPTFVWSRENGSVVFSVEHVSDRSAKLVDGWRDVRFGLAIGDVVEIAGNGHRRRREDPRGARLLAILAQRSRDIERRALQREAALGELVPKHGVALAGLAP